MTSSILSARSRRLLAVAALAAMVLAASFWRAPAADFQIVVPSFWDPDRHLDKPDLGGLRTIRFLTEDDFPPFHFAAADGSLVGFDIDLARAVCEELKLTCTLQARRFDTLVDSLNAGRGDALIAGLAINAEARAKLGFTAPYYTTPGRFVGGRASVPQAATPEAFAGKKIGVVAGSTHEAYLKAFFPEAAATAFPTVEAARAALKKGDVELLFGDAIGLSLWLNGTDAGDCCGFVGGPFTESRYFGEGVGIAVKKDNVILRQALDYALAALAERGVYADLYLKYFPIGAY